MQKIYGVESGLALNIDEMLEIPTHQKIDPAHRAGGDMPRIVLGQGVSPAYYRLFEPTRQCGKPLENLATTFFPSFL